MDYELKDILDRGLDIIYDGQGYFKRWEWRDSLEDRLREYFERQFKLKNNNPFLPKK